jgi:DNA-binding GntR family transcriptional regulator
MLQRALKQVPDDVAEALKLKPRDKGVLLKRLVLVNDVPLSINTSWFPATLVPGLQNCKSKIALFGRPWPITMELRSRARATR